MTTAAQILAIAAGELGTVEVPPNSNRTKYGAWYGMDGQPWCGMFVSWVFSQAGMGQIHFAYCPTGRNDFNKRGRLFAAPQVGDVVFYEWEHDILVDHTGIVEEVRPTYIVAIEGNTQTGTTGNQSDGGGVFRRTRSLSVCHGFGRPDYQQGVKPMFDPPLILEPIAASLKDPATGGTLLLGQSGGIYAFEGARFNGAAAGKAYFAGHKAALLEERHGAAGTNTDPWYVIRDTAGARYGDGGFQ